MAQEETFTTGRMFSVLWEYVKPVFSRELVGCVALVSHSYILILIPKYVKEIINRLGLETISQSQLVHKCGWILVLSALSAALLFMARWFIIGASRTIERNMRNDFLHHIQKLTPRFFHENKTGDLMTRFASDIEQVRMLIGPGIMYPMTTIVTVVLALYSMYTVNASLTVTLLIPIVILLVYVNIYTRFLYRFFRRSQEVYSDMTAMIQENFSGIRVIKAYTQEEAEFQRFRALNDQYIEANIGQIKLRGRLFPFMKFIGSVGMVFILWFGGIRVINGSLMVGDLVQFNLYYMMLMWPIIALGWIINVIHRGTASLRRLMAVFSIEPDILDHPGLAPASNMLGEIELRDLTFAYSENLTPVLKNISFHIQPGQTLAIVGPTGSGKSTIVNILLHLYPIPPGCVFIDGKDINEISLSDLRQATAYVSQDVFLFSNTVRSNINFGISDESQIDETRMMQAAKEAQLAGEVETFPQQYDTEIGERGITLSGGQKQRTGIARALILNRPVLILDDCLSNVDTHTEEAILQSLHAHMENRTVILISHRISTVKNADRIIVLEDGAIVEEGTHDELVAFEGLYARIHRRQLLEESLGIKV